MVLVIATAALVYELVMAAVASYVLGDSVTQFSTVIGVYLSALGIGAYLSRYIENQLALRFVDVELATALIGGISAPGLMIAFSYVGAFRLVLYTTVLAVGILCGLELPLLMRILRRDLEFKELVAKALTFDYAGALIGSLAFSLLLLPKLGLVATSLACGLLNALVGLASTWVLAPSIGDRRALAFARLRAGVVAAILFGLLLAGNRLVELAESALYPAEVVQVTQSEYQRIVLTRQGEGFQLHLNGNLQFSSIDEHRYHEALVHPAMAVAGSRKQVLIGGGGDGLALREVLRWPELERATLVDLDPAVTALARTHPLLTAANRGALAHDKATIINADAIVWFAETDRRFDVIVLDFPDPSNYSLGKLYSKEFYRTVRQRLTPGGALVVQAASPYFARRAYWSIVATLESVGFSVVPYRVFVPSFGEWGFALAKLEAFEPPQSLPELGLSYLDPRTLPALFALPPDLARVPAPVNRLNNQALVGEYVDAWARWN